jgi:molecular chaperone DnaK (HSP70)
MEVVRAFGSDALGQAAKAPAKVPMFFQKMLGNNFTTEADVKTGGAWWDAFGLDSKFYSFDLEYQAERGTPAFFLGENKTFSKEEVLANMFHFTQKIAQENAEGKPVRDLVVTVPPEANLRYRQAIVAAAEIAGLRALTLVHEGAAFAVQRAVDFAPEKGNVERALFLQPWLAQGRGDHNSVRKPTSWHGRGQDCPRCDYSWLCDRLSSWRASYGSQNCSIDA